MLYVMLKFDSTHNSDLAQLPCLFSLRYDIDKITALHFTLLSNIKIGSDVLEAYLVII